MFAVDSAGSSLGLCFRAAAPVLGRWAAVREVHREAGMKGDMADSVLWDEVHWFHLNLM